MNDHIQDVTRRFADAGYHAVAPALFHRAGGGTAPYDDFDKVLPAVRGAHRPRDPHGRRRRASRTCTRAGFDDGAIGIVGFCMGGRVTFLVSLERALGAAVGLLRRRHRHRSVPAVPAADRAGRRAADAVARAVRRRGRLDPGRRRRAAAPGARRRRRADRRRALRRRRARVPLRPASELQRRGRHRRVGAHARLVRGAPGTARLIARSRWQTPAMGDVLEALDEQAHRLDRPAARVLRGHRAVRRRPREPVAQGARRAAGARPTDGRVPRPHRQRRRDDRPHPGERSHDDHVLRLRRPAADPPALRPGRRRTRSDRRATRSSSTGSSRSSAPARSSSSPSNGCRRRAATRSRSWTTARSARRSSSGPPARATTACAEYWAEKNAESIDGLPALD